MRLLLTTFVICLIFVSTGLGQPKLRKNIGLTHVPKSLEEICPVPLNLTFFDRNGPNFLDTAYDFTLYDREGNPLTLSTTLLKKKPVLLICGSYTCPIFRSKVGAINGLMERYGDKISIFIIYNFEAHPIIDDPPYLTNNENANAENEAEGIQYPNLERTESAKQLQEIW